MTSTGRCVVMHIHCPMRLFLHLPLFHCDFFLSPRVTSSLAVLAPMHGRKLIVVVGYGVVFIPRILGLVTAVC